VIADRRSLVEPLKTLTRLVQTRRPDTLEQLPAAGLPVEVQPLVVALNELLGRLRAALEHERAFIADAAHELRSPLTALDLQIQTLDSAADEPSRARALGQLRSGVQRANRLVEQMLSLARQQRGPAAAPERVSLVELALEVIEESLPLADRRHIDLGLAHAEPVAIQGDTDALRVLLRNLLDNALRYTPDGGQVDVLVRREQAATGATAVLEVIDTGPGIPETERTRVFDRFYRVPGTASSGSGIGLALVWTIAERHRGRVDLGPGRHGRGLSVRVTLPVTTS
jgi:two-component system OmpR family sensor kinase